MRKDADKAAVPAPSTASWYDVACAVRPRLSEVPRGRREQGIAELAAAYGLKNDTLRRYVAAAAFLDQFEELDPAVSRSLRTRPVAAVELIARWFAYEPDAASKAARDLRDGRYTIFTLRAAERDARTATKDHRAGRSGAHLLRQRVASKIKELVQQSGQAKYVESLPNKYDPKRIDFLFSSKADPNKRIAVLIFGPFSDEQQYSNKQEDFLVKVLGLSRCFTEVVAIVPDRQSSNAGFEDWLDHYSSRREDSVDNVTFYYIDLATLNIRSPRSMPRRL